MVRNRLYINALKTKAMLFGSSVPNLDIDIHGTKIEFVDHMYCLGLWLDNKLTFERHINFVTSRVNYSLRRLYNVNLCLPMHIKTTIIHSLVMPIFLYGIEVYTGTLGCHMKKLLVLFNRVIRYLYCLRLQNHVSMYVSKFLGCSFYDYVKIRLLLCFYNMFKRGTIEYMIALFSFSRSRRNCQILIPKLTSLVERSFHVRVARIFNQLPRTLKSFEYSSSTYKRKLLRHIQRDEM